MLYEYKNGYLTSYTLKEKKDQIKEYKINVLKKNNKEILFYDFNTNNIETKNDFENSKDLDIRDFDYDISIGKNEKNDYCEIIPSENRKEQEKYIEKYINGKYDKLSISNVYDEEGYILYNFLKPETSEIYITKNKINIYTIKNMINIPKSLYLLNLLQNEQYQSLIGENIDRQLQLFDLKTNYSSLYILTDNSLTENVKRKDILKKAKTDEKILKKIRKR